MPSDAEVPMHGTHRLDELLDRLDRLRLDRLRDRDERLRERLLEDRRLRLRLRLRERLRLRVRLRPLRPLGLGDRRSDFLACETTQMTNHERPQRQAQGTALSWQLLCWATVGYNLLTCTLRRGYQERA